MRCGLGAAVDALADLVAGRLIAPFALDLATDEGFFLVEPDDGSRRPDARHLRDWLLAEAGKDRP